MSLIELNTKPSSNILKWFGLILFIFLNLISLLVYFKFAYIILSLVLLITSTIILIIYYSIPQFRISIYMIWIGIFYPVGCTVQYTLLAITYFTAFTLTGFLIKLIKIDPMNRNFDFGAQTYWLKRKRNTEISRYFRQF